MGFDMATQYDQQYQREFIDGILAFKVVHDQRSADIQLERVPISDVEIHQLPTQMFSDTMGEIRVENANPVIGDSIDIFLGGEGIHSGIELLFLGDDHAYEGVTGSPLLPGIMEYHTYPVGAQCELLPSNGIISVSHMWGIQRSPLYTNRDQTHININIEGGNLGTLGTSSAPVEFYTQRDGGTLELNPAMPIFYDSPTIEERIDPAVGKVVARTKQICACCHKIVIFIVYEGGQMKVVEHLSCDCIGHELCDKTLHCKSHCGCEDHELKTPVRGKRNITLS